MRIALEAIDFAGKGTLIEFLKRKFPDALFLHEPGGTPISDEISRLTNMGGEHLTQLFLFLAARNELVTKVLLKNPDRLTFIDRYAYSTLAYQGANGTDMSVITSLSLLLPQVEPDLTLYIHIPIEVFEERRNAVGIRNPLDSKPLKYYQKVMEIYNILESIDPNMVAIDGTQTPEKVAEDAMRILEARLGLVPE